MSVQKIQLPDQRELCFQTFGDEEGFPILFITGAGMSGSLVVDEDILREEHLRLISFDRPGIGCSTNDADRTFGSTLDDIEILRIHLNITTWGCLAFSQGAIFAYALAAENLVSSCVIVSGQDDLQYPTTREQLDPQVRDFCTRITNEFETLSKELKSFLTPESFMNMVLSMSSEQDRNFYTEPNFMDRYQTAVTEGIGKSLEGYLIDLKLALRPWPFMIENISVPIHLWYGAQDISGVHSPDHGKTLKRRNPLFHLTEIPNEGGAILWTHTRDILKCFKANISTLHSEY